MYIKNIEQVKKSIKDCELVIRKIKKEIQSINKKNYVNQPWLDKELISLPRKKIDFANEYLAYSNKEVFFEKPEDLYLWLIKNNAVEKLFKALDKFAPPSKVILPNGELRGFQTAPIDGFSCEIYIVIGMDKVGNLRAIGGNDFFQSDSVIYKNYENFWEEYDKSLNSKFDKLEGIVKYSKTQGFFDNYLLNYADDVMTFSNIAPVYLLIIDSIENQIYSDLFPASLLFPFRSYAAGKDFGEV
jgi:hypothetical protein